MNLDKLIDQWIEGNDINIFDSNIMAQGYIDCKKDLKSRKQELIEGIKEWASGQDDGRVTDYLNK